jgi:hypothetical protein
MGRWVGRAEVDLLFFDSFFKPTSSLAEFVVLSAVSFN